MNRRLFLKLIVFLYTAFVLGSCSNTEAPQPPQQPNFIIIFADDQGYADLGSFGAVDFKTTHIDKLASEGMRFTDFYAQPVCGPSRTALLTSSYPARVAEFGNEKRAFPYVHSEEILLPSILQDAGYATAWIGKVDITDRKAGYRPSLNPVRRGFDYFFGPIGANDDGYVELLHRNETVIEEKAQLDDLTQRYTQEALQFIRDNRDGPFFLYVAHTMPHVVLAASDEFRGRSERGLYGDVIEELDDSTGRIVALLRELELDNSTILVYTSDNGPWTNHPAYRDEIREHAGDAGPLRGGKATTWEGGIRVPMVAWGPGYIPAGATNSEIATTMDLLPTFIDIAGAKLPGDRIIDGTSIAPLLRGETNAKSPHEAFYYYLEHQLEAVRSGNWKLVFPRSSRGDSAWLQGRVSVGTHFEGPGLDAVIELALYDLESDIGEQHNVAAQHPDVVRQLQALAEQARNDIGDRDRIGDGVRFFEDGPKWPKRAEWLQQPAE